MKRSTVFAGALTMFGLSGLALSPLILTPAISAPAEATGSVTMAITTGPQLRLLRAGQDQQTGRAGMVCRKVFRMAFADVGFRCRQHAEAAAAPPGASAFAIARQ